MCITIPSLEKRSSKRFLENSSQRTNISPVNRTLGAESNFFARFNEDISVAILSIVCRTSFNESFLREFVIRVSHDSTIDLISFSLELRAGSALSTSENTSDTITATQALKVKFKPSPP